MLLLPDHETFQAITIHHLNSGIEQMSFFAQLKVIHLNIYCIQEYGNLLFSHNKEDRWIVRKTGGTKNSLKKVSRTMSPRYFFTVDKDCHLKILHEEHAAGMVNVLRAEQGILQAAYRAYPLVPLVLDSGALQGNTNIQQYSESIKRLSWRFQWFSSLDVLGDPDQSERNYNNLLSTSLSNDLQQRIIWIYQTNPTHSLRVRQKHLNALHAVLSERNYTRIGIGGLVPFLMHTEGVIKALHILEEIRDVFLATGTQTKAHLFGVGSPTLLLWSSQQSWIESLDSGKWLLAWKAGRVLRLFGDNRKPEKDLGLPLLSSEAAALNIRVIQRWLDPDAIHQLVLPSLIEPVLRNHPFTASHATPVDEPRIVRQLPLWSDINAEQLT